MKTGLISIAVFICIMMAASSPSHYIGRSYIDTNQIIIYIGISCIAALVIRIFYMVKKIYAKICLAENQVDKDDGNENA